MHPIHHIAVAGFCLPVWHEKETVQRTGNREKPPLTQAPRLGIVVLTEIRSEEK
jgi:hypothetical protein